VLTRFRQETVNLEIYVDGMFHQVIELEKRTFELTFLWFLVLLLHNS